MVAADIKPVPSKPMTSKRPAGYAFPTMGMKGPETFELPVPLLPIIEDGSSPVRRNGIGELLLMCFGTDTPAQLGGTIAYAHTFTWADQGKSASVWLHYGTDDNEKIRFNVADSFDFKLSADRELSLDFLLKGTELWDVLDADYGTEAQVDPATAKMLNGLKSRLEFGQPGAGVREAYETLAASFKRNYEFGSPSTDGQHPTGSGAPKIATSTQNDATMSLNLRDADREEIKRARAGGNIAPTASRQSDVAALVDGRITTYGPAICAGINSEADYNNAGTTALSVLGTYSEGDVVTVGEIEMSDTDVYETASGVTNGELSLRFLDAAATYEVVTGSALAVGVVAKAITVTLATGGSTATAILNAVLNTPAAIALITPTLANGNTGAGLITEAQAEVGAASLKDGFRFRYTIGIDWSDWSAWIAITKAAQDLVYGLTATFDDDDITASGDMFYFCSHYRYGIRINMPNLQYKDAAKPSFSGGIRMADIELEHTSTTAGNRPTVVLYDTRSTAYS